MNSEPNVKWGGDTDEYSFPYLQERQSISSAPTEWQLSFALALEQAFAQGHHELSPLVNALNSSSVRPMDGSQWTEENFQAIVRELGR